MLEEIMKEWENASQNAISVEDKMNEDGETFEFRKSVVNFRGVAIEILAKRRPGSGLVKDAELDPSKGPSYLVTIFVPSTGKILENIPTSEICPQTERMIAILQSLDVYDHDGLVNERCAEYSEKSVENQLDTWLKELDGTDFSDEEKKLFVEYAKDILAKRIVKYRADIFFQILKKYHKQIIAKDLEACGAVETNKKISYTLADVMYNMTCQCLEKQQKNTHGDYFIPKFVIENRFWNADGDAKMSLYIRVARSIFRGIHTDCNEKPTTLAYVLNGMAKYYEATTGESVQMRLARNAARKKNAKSKNENAKGEKTFKPTEKKVFKKSEKIEFNKPASLGTMAAIFEKVGL